LHPVEPERFLAFVFHNGSLRSKNTLSINLIAGQVALSRNRQLLCSGNPIELA
jgi:hypothetical protein